MSPKDLPGAYLKKCKSRLKALKVLLDDDDFSDVVRESQEVVELCSKGILRMALIDPPHRHDLGDELAESIKLLGQKYKKKIDELIIGNHWLRREREMAFYGAEDFDPTQGYAKPDADRAMAFAKLAVDILESLIAEQSEN